MPVPPTWLGQLANAAADALRPIDVLSPLGCHYCEVEGVWEVTIFVALTEVVGGIQDGRLRKSNFSLDLKQLTYAFDSISTFHWQALPVDRQDELGPHVAVEGTVEGHAVWLRVLAHPPCDYPVGRQALVNETVWKEVW